MPFSIGINFRATSGYVADGAGETYWTGGSYPITRGGATFGSTSGSPEFRDRSDVVDRRIAGIVFERPGAPMDFRLDLANGSYEIGVLACDSGGVAAGTNAADFEVWDGTATKLIDQGSSGTNVGNTGNCLDAAGNLTAQSEFVNELVPVSITQAFVTFRTIATTFSVIAHVFAREVATGNPTGNINNSLRSMRHAL